MRSYERMQELKVAMEDAKKPRRTDRTRKPSWKANIGDFVFNMGYTLFYAGIVLTLVIAVLILLLP